MDHLQREMLQRLSEIPFFDAHDHVMHAQMMSNLHHHIDYDANADARTTSPSILACLILDLSNLVQFRVSGMPDATLQGILKGSLRGDAARKALLEEHEIEIGAGLGPLAGRVWRVGLMGHTARPENVKRLLEALRSLLEGQSPGPGA